MKFKLVTVVAAFAALSLSASPVIAKDKNDKEDEAGAGPATIPAPPPGKGQIVFYRPGGMGFALGCSVNEQGQKISSLGAGRYFILVTSPGRHEYTVKSEAKDTLALEVEADETQYAKCRIKMGIMVGRPDLAPGTEAEKGSTVTLIVSSGNATAELPDVDRREIVFVPRAGHREIDEGVDEIVRLTHCQPFLVQAMCAMF